MRVNTIVELLKKEIATEFLYLPSMNEWTIVDKRSDKVTIFITKIGGMCIIKYQSMYNRGSLNFCKEVSFIMNGNYEGIDANIKFDKWWCHLIEYKDDIKITKFLYVGETHHGFKCTVSKQRGYPININFYLTEMIE